ncbi:ectonucleotide pyrophosphatase/phosphodiesterase family member 5-like [Contarinia nasturtii]|uniref:ectonucleotide pyrophosphatase/phosphodiesterase family member 5-like n=1 Tax=Contarinia nasturtii TaxID=265458 RepID=UPI0012D45364|nr:ectonucleotide pyrophosphatase/phosphodiesterase family member 5-like [Contarinia nasturtii]
MKILIAAAFFCAAISLSTAAPKKAKNEAPKLIVISLDALMFSQIQKNVTPFIYNFYKKGVHCPKVRPVFPTKTMTNHFSIATGLYAGSHGVTNNRIYDNLKKNKVSYSAEFFQSRVNVTPIWTLNEMAGKHSAVSMWASSEYEFRGIMPTYVEKYARDDPWKPRIDKIIPLLKSKENAVDFVMFYSEQPDSTDHEFSHKSVQVTERLKDMDAMVKYLMEQVKNAGLAPRTDVIIMSDHGMEFVTADDNFIVDLSKYVSYDTCQMYGDSAVMQVVANDGQDIVEICNKLKNGSRQNKHFKAYLNDDLPEYWHVRNERLFGPCTVVAEPGYAFENIKNYFALFSNYHHGRKYGYHGYDNKAPSMQATFLANGPRFKKSVRIKYMEIVDMFHLFARLLGIESLVPDLNIDGIDKPDLWAKMLKQL